MSPALEDEARAKARRSTTQDHTHACSGANAMRQPDCEEKRDPDLAKSRIKDENMELDPKARLEKRTLAEQPFAPSSAHLRRRISKTRRTLRIPLDIVSLIAHSFEFSGLLIFI